MRVGTPIDCPREGEVIESAASGRYDEDLRAHVLECGVCRELAPVATAMREARASAWNDVRVPASGLVWWRLERRARHEAARAAARPIAFAQAFAAACGLVLAAALFAAAWPLLASWIGQAQPTAGLVNGGALASLFAAMVRWAAPLVIAIIAWIVFAPLAIYLVFSDR